MEQWLLCISGILVWLSDSSEQRLSSRITARVNVKKTEELYRQIERHTRDNAASLNFAKVLNEIVPDCKYYFGALGIDPLGFQDLSIESVKAEKQQMICSGYYPLILENEEELMKIISVNDEHDDDFEEISTDLGFEISFDTWNNHIALSFVKIVPWLLTPALIKGKYENKDSIPEVDIDSFGI